MTKSRFLLLLFIPIILFGCRMKIPIDLLVFNGKIYSVDSVNHVYDAMAVRNGKIYDVGKSADLRARYKAVQELDAQGNSIFPGFIDAHCHFLGFALNQQYADLTGAQSFDEVIERLKQASDRMPDSWLKGRGWDQNLWKNKEFPDKSKLDALYPDRPVMLIRVDGHSVLCNQKALSLAGIGLVNNFKPGEVEVKNGKLTGILSENAADKMKSIVPTPDRRVKQILLKKAENLCFSVGLCMVNDAGLDYEDIRLMDSMQRSGSLKIRIYAMLNPTTRNMKEYVDHGPYETEKLTVRSIKMYADGSLGSRTALMKSPYSDDPGKTGIQVTPTDSIIQICKIAYEKGFQMNTHCIGDSAVRMILDIYGSFLKGKNDLRWRIEHAQVVDLQDLHLFADYSVIPSVQATHATSDMHWAKSRIGQVRIKRAYAYKQLLLQNGWIPNGTDFPIENISPILTFYAAVARRDLSGYPEGGFQMENALTREEALRSITIWAAKADFLDWRSGSLEVGKNADFVILSKDIMQVQVQEIPLVKVLQTYISGERVH